MHFKCWSGLAREDGRQNTKETPEKTNNSKRCRMRLLKSMVPVALAVLFSAVAQAQPQVSVYNWTDYIGETTLVDFQA
jgi:spermidine/putrescine-binding protein